MARFSVIVLCALVLVACSFQGTHNPAVPQQSSAGIEVNPPMELHGKEVMGQTIYVPIYSHIYIQDKSRSLNLAATLSIRNTDTRNPIYITSACYFNTDGSLVREYVKAPLRISPMAATEIVVAEKDTTGGSGASFVVEWSAGAQVTEPVIEAVMIGAAGQQGISFISTGRVIKSRGI